MSDKTGRNDPCPCGSGHKYKLCCGDADVKALREDHLRMKILAHLFLTQLQKLTGAPAIAVEKEALAHYPAHLKVRMVSNPENGVFLFAAEQPEQPLIEASRRIVLPNRK